MFANGGPRLAQAVVLVNLINLFGTPVLMFGAKLGVAGAALAAVLGQIGGLGYLLALLRAQGAMSFDLAAAAAALSQAIAFLKPTGYLLARTTASMLVFTLAASLAAQAGPVQGAAHQVVFQLWLAASLLADSLAIACQSLLAQQFGARNWVEARAVIRRTAQLGIALGVLTGATMLAAAPVVPYLFSQQHKTRALVAALFPVVALTQPVSALAFTMDGVLYGAGGFETAAWLMPINASPAIALMLGSKASRPN